jgi:pilus assembly protein Flp/PilA
MLVLSENGSRRLPSSRRPPEPLTRKELPVMMAFLTTLQLMVTDKLAARDDEGATMVEYGLMVALIAVIVAVAVGPLGIAIRNMFQAVTAQL